MKTSRLVFFARSPFSFSISAPLRPMMMPGTRGVNRDAQLVARPVDFDRADAGRLQPVAQRVLQLQIFAQQLGVILLGEPARPPGLGDAQPEPVRMYFLTHSLFLASFAVSRPSPQCATSSADSGTRAPSAPAARASCAALRSHTPRSRTACRRPHRSSDSRRWRSPSAAPFRPTARCACWSCAEC